MGKLKQVMVYLPANKREALKAISVKKRVPLTRIMEKALDMYLNQEGYDFKNDY